MASRPVRIGERLAVEVEELAQAQHRSFANMVAHLVRLGLEQEKGPERMQTGLLLPADYGETAE